MFGILFLCQIVWSKSVEMTEIESSVSNPIKMTSDLINNWNLKREKCSYVVLLDIADETYDSDQLAKALTGCNVLVNVKKSICKRLEKRAADFIIVLTDASVVVSLFLTFKLCCCFLKRF